MKAMILAAGLGARLRPLTDTMPKALVQVNGEPLLAHVIQRLKLFGADSVVVNTHAHAQQVEKYLASHDFGLPISTLFEPEILETAGGISNAREYLRDPEPVIVHNVDIISQIDLKALWRFHLEHNAFATVAVRKPANERPFLVDSNGCIVGHRNKLTGKEQLASGARHFEEYNFCGIHVFSQEFLDSLVAGKTHGVSITSAYLDFIWEGYKILTFDIGSALWHDVGTVEKLQRAEQKL